MKGIGAPKKIYVPRLEGNETFIHEWSATKFRKYFSREIAENVEYIRADAFIEKAKNFLWEHIDGTDYHVNYILKEFERYMKGE